MTLSSRLKRGVNDLLKHYGYRVERIVDYRKHQLDVFELAVNSLVPSDPDFFFIQVGANDGRRGDPIYGLVERYHWRGLLLEPQPDVFATLTSNYRNEPQLILENAALASEDGMVSLYRVAGSSLRATFNRAALAGHVGESGQITEIPVRAVTFRSLLARHSIGRVDLLLVDTEGFDYQVIKMALAEGVRPRLLQYEHLHLSTADRQACVSLLVGHGYRLFRDGGDTIALANEHA